MVKAGLTLPGAPRLQGVVGPPSHPGALLDIKVYRGTGPTTDRGGGGGGVRCDASVTRTGPTTDRGGVRCDASVTRTGPTTDRGVRCDASVTRTGSTTDRGGGECDASVTRTGPTTDRGGGACVRFTGAQQINTGARAPVKRVY